MTTIRRVVAAVLWLAAVAVIALGAAGLVTGMDTPPVSGSRSELTARGDELVTASLDATQAELQRLADDVAELGVEARGALAALNGSDLETVEAAVARGDALVTEIKTRSSAIAAALAATPLIGTPEGDYEVSNAVRDRHAALVESLGATEGLETAWSQLTIGSVAASRLSAQLRAHDDAVVAAAALGRDAKYDDAVSTLEDASAAIAEARTLRDRLARSVDVSTLDQWLDRNADYDAALRDLYLALRDVGGRVTDDVRDAIAAEQAAKDRLPPDARGLILIMAEIGRGGMNDAIISIEEARGRLADALSDTGPSDAPSAAPSAPG